MIRHQGSVGYRPGNEWLRRAADPVRYRALLRIGLIGVLALLAILAAYWPRHEAVRLGYRTEELREEKERLEREIERLQLRLGELANPERVERLSRERLGLDLPSQVAVLDDAPRPASRTAGGGGGGAASSGASPRR